MCDTDVLHGTCLFAWRFRMAITQADAQRKAERKKEVARNKLERKFIRSAGKQRDKPEDIKKQLQEVRGSSGSAFTWHHRFCAVDAWVLDNSWHKHGRTQVDWTLAWSCTGQPLRMHACMDTPYRSCMCKLQ